MDKINDHIIVGCSTLHPTLSYSKWTIYLVFLGPMLEIAAIILNTGFISFSMSETDSVKVINLWLNDSSNQ